MLYIDQPFGAGFSYSTQRIDTTDAAASVVWEFLQAFYDQFPQYESRDFGIWSESYGGRKCNLWQSEFVTRSNKDWLDKQTMALDLPIISMNRILQ